MSVRNKGRRAGWVPVLALLVLGFALTTCSSNKGAEKPGAQAESAKTEAAATSATENGAKTETAAQAAAESNGTAQRMGAEQTPLGDKVEIRKSWVQVRAEPSQKAAAIALAFGNDTYPVIGHQDDWVQVRLDRKREGWIPRSATEP